MKKEILIQFTLIYIIVVLTAVDFSTAVTAIFSFFAVIAFSIYFWNRFLTTHEFGNTLLFISSSLLGLQLVTYSLQFEHHEKLMLTTVLLAFGSLIPLYIYLKLTKSAELKSKANQLLWYTYIFGNFLFLLYLHDKMDWKL